jgi:N-acyl-L-homoserine lactone synthetase
MSEYTFKIATEPWEVEQIHRLNYRIFVEEIPQHAPNPERRLVDKFHEQNTYIICLYDSEVIGMIAFRDQRPFSLDAKLDNLDQYLPPANSICEVRLLAIDAAHRKRRILPGLLRQMVKIGVNGQYDLLIISGTTRQLRMYKGFGYVPFGPLVGKPGAMYQPMYLTREALAAKAPWLIRMELFA